MATSTSKSLNDAVRGSYVDQTDGTTAQQARIVGTIPGTSIGGFTNHSVIFASSTGTLTQDNNNLYFNDAASGSASVVQLSVGTSGDFTGTDTINIYGQIDAYNPNSVINGGSGQAANLLLDGLVPGLTASSSRGTGASPSNLSSGDFVGAFAAWGYTNSAFTPLSVVLGAANGASASNLGGELQFWTKADGGVLTQQGTINNLGFLSVGPTTPLAMLDIGKDHTTTVALSASGALLRARGAITITDGAGTGTIALAAVNSLSAATAPTLAASSAVTYTDAPTVYIGKAPVAGTNVTITNAHALLVGGATTISTTSANAFVVGPAGLTSPGFQIDNSVASAVTGLQVQPQASGSGITLTTLSSASNDGMTLGTKGTGTWTVKVGSASKLVLTTSTAAFTPTSANNTAATVRFSLTNGPDSALTASAEAPHTYFNFGSATRTHAAGALSLQRDFRVTGTSHAFASSSTLTDMAAFAVDPGSAGANATVTNNHSIYIPSVALTGTVTNSYGLTVNAHSGATNNFAAQFVGTVFHNGGVQEKLTSVSDANYTVLLTDRIIRYITLTAGRTVTLPAPAAATIGQAFMIKDEVGTAGTNTITVQGAAGNVDGAANKTITTNYGVLRVYHNGSNYFTY